MKILWITNILMPAISKEIGIKTSVFGGWMASSAKYLSESDGVELAIATVYSGDSLISKELEGIRYYLLPFKGKRTKYNPSLEQYWRRVHDEYSPDVVHIHGSEYPYGLAYVRACGNTNVVVSIQGMTSVYANHYYADIDVFTILKNISISDFLIGKTIFGGRRTFLKRGLLECRLLEKVQHVIGRTTWDRMHSECINSNVNYHFCNETLRNAFYDGKWSYKECSKHTIFVPQASYPIKGVHKVVEAMAFIAARYPDVKLRIAGANIIKHGTIKEKIAISGYGKIVLSLIKKHNLEDKICFTGLLGEVEMKHEYLKANVFVCPSSIENSPNSLGEAQLLGTPCVASYVGGIPDMVSHNETGFLYRFEDVEMLASYICKVFEMKDGAEEFFRKERDEALARHNGETNNQTLLEIYRDIAQN